MQPAPAGTPSGLRAAARRPVLAALGLVALSAPAPPQAPGADYASVFDEHWERLRDEYPFFERYGVDWEAERAEHRPRAVAAESPTEFAWEIARMLTALGDRHVDFAPPAEVIGSWSVPDIRSALIERRPHVIEWKEWEGKVGPPAFRDDPRACPEIVAVAGAPIGSACQILAAGPPGTELVMRLRWPDGTETDEVFPRPAEGDLSSRRKHYGERWIVSGRVGDVGYLRVKTFQPASATLGPAGKMTPILREHVKRLLDTDALILDLQSNGGGVVGASDPFLSHFLTERVSYRWGNSGGRSRVLVPRSPRYRGEVVVIVDELSASGGEWAARILRDAGRAVVIGGPTMGAEAAVHSSQAADGSTINFSAWPMAEPGVTPFQDTGVELDHALPLTIAEVREHGFERARARVRRARYAKALEVLGGGTEGLDELVELAEEAEREEPEEPR